MLLETFIIVMALMSLCFYILFSVESIYSVGISMYSGIILYTYLFTPMLSVVFIYLAHSMQPKTPIVKMHPYKVFGVCSIIAVVLFLLLTNFMGLIQVPFFGLISNSNRLASCNCHSSLCCNSTSRGSEQQALKEKSRHRTGR